MACARNITKVGNKNPEYRVNDGSDNAAARQWKGAKMDRTGLDLDELFDYQGVKGVKGFARADPSDAQIKAKLAEKQFEEDVEKYEEAGELDKDSKVPLARQLRRLKEAEGVHEAKAEAEKMKKEEEEMKKRAEEAKAAKKKDPAQRKKEAEERRARLKAKKEAEKAGAAAGGEAAGEAEEKTEEAEGGEE